ncbi:Bug family tripartite tricarboxylate transporter substrate binding protein [Ottowia thiooxydans]|uniref:Bug family tripartite tricarboxylate transporter substrate binding protein n=1 Tax=Ottowia thiooxydans TaxID=219182 RepID=UPI000414E8EA|nr:tripartite tricarboxylate transporter substrate binding protein [Ottowia thiooxydans]
MRLTLHSIAGLCVTTLGLGLLAAPAVAQDNFPNRPITLVVPYPAGGGGDAQGRILALKLGEKLGQNVVVDNRPGAGTAIGASFVSKSRPDGYTLIWTSASTFTFNPAISTNLSYDPVKGFEPIGMGSNVAMVLLANANTPVNDVKGLVAELKANPTKYSYASFGNGTAAHFAAEMMLGTMGAKMLHVPYKGSAPAMTDLIGGQVSFSMDTVTAALPQLKGGKVKAIAVTSAKRSQQLPDVPTFTESGYPLDVTSWGMLAAPPGLPPAVRAKLEKALAETIADPQVRQGFATQGVEALFVSGAKAAAQIERELPAMRAMAARAGIQGN